MKTLLNKLFPNLFKIENNEEVKSVVETPITIDVKDTKPASSEICTCDSNCVCKNKKQPIKKKSIKKNETVKKPIVKAVKQKSVKKIDISKKNKPKNKK